MRANQFFAAIVLITFLFIHSYPSILSAEENITEITKQALITGEDVEVYEDKSTESKTLHILNNGNIVNILNQNDPWIEVEWKTNETGFVLSDSIEYITEDQSYLEGIILNEGNVFIQPNIDSETINTLDTGEILTIRNFSTNWYITEIDFNGKQETGYILKTELELASSDKTDLTGIAKKSSTKVYNKASTSSKALKSYDQGSILRYQTFTSDWYKATVIVNGKRLTGYIHKSHVEEPTNKPQNKQGIAKQATTKVYSKASTSSKTLKSYEQGSVLKYQTFTSDWYKATVFVNGKRLTGYIHKNHVEEPTNKPQNKQGIAKQATTKVYSKASTSSKALKSYEQGSVLKYQTFTSDWYKATVILNGKRLTGYIYKNHVEEATSTSVSKRGVAMKAPTKVYSTPNKNSRVHKSYQAGNILKYETFTSDWYKATVYIKGKKHTGYIHKNDVEEPITNQKSLEGIAYKGKTHVYSGPHRNAGTLKSYNDGSLLKYRTYLNNWYQATVYVNGKKHTGYIHKNDVFAPNKKQSTLSGIAVRPTTYVYQSTSTSSKKLKGYKLGSSLKYETYTENWYRATVYINDKKHTGYIHKNHVGERYVAKSIVNPRQKYSYNQMQSDINQLIRNYPGLITREVIGKSVEGRNIDLLKVGFGDIKITVNASHHGREWMTTNLVMYQIDQYAQAFANNRKFDGHDVRDILSKVTIYFVPMVNPDGVTLSQFGANGFSNKSALIRMNKGSSNFTAWKANARGVDLNRQYPADWAKIKNNATSPSYAFYKGTRPLSEPEAKAVYDLALKNKFATHVAYHSSGEIIYWAFKEKGAQLALNRSVAQLISNKTGYPLVPQATNPSGGGYKDWAIDTLKVPGFTIEISPYVVERPVPLSYFDRIWRQNNSIPLILAKEAAIRNR